MDLKKWERSLKAAICGFAGGFLALAAWKRIEWSLHPERFAFSSAPFYVHLLPAACLTAAFIALAAVVLALVRRRRRRCEKEK